jgi:hypothetical protein
MTFPAEAAGHLLAALPAVLGQGLLVTLLWAVLWGAGRGWIGRWMAPRQELSSSVSLALWPVLGLAALGTAGFLLGLAGALSPGSLGLLALVGNALALPAWRCAAGGLRASFRVTPSALLAGAAFVPVLAPALLLTLYPPNLTDDLLYHLPMTRSLAETGRLTFLETLRYPVFPQLQETLWSTLYAPFGLRGVEAFVLLHGLLAGTAVYATTRHLVSPSPRARSLGLLAAALWAGCPAVVLFGTAGFVDVPLAAFVAVAGLAITRGLATGDRRWALLAGLAAGAGAATKFHGLVLTMLLALPWLWAALRSGPTPRAAAWRRLALYALAAAAVAGPWYGRMLAETGNPVFPFLEESFGVFSWNGEPYTDPASVFSARSEEDYGTVEPGVEDGHRADRRAWTVPLVLGRRIGRAVVEDLEDLPRLVVELTVTGRRTHGPPPLAVWLLPLVAVALGLAVFGRRSPGWPVAVAALFFAFWFITFRDPRYLLPVVALALPALTAPMAWPAWPARLAGLAERRALPTALLVPLVLVLSVSGWLYGAYRVATLGPVPTSAEEARTFHDLRLPGHALLEEVEARRRPGETVYLLGRPRLRYFLPGRVLGDHLGFFAFGTLAPTLRQPGATAPVLRRWGVDLLVTFSPTPPIPTPPGSGLVEVFRDARGAIYRVTGDAPGDPFVTTPP